MTFLRSETSNPFKFLKVKKNALSMSFKSCKLLTLVILFCISLNVNTTYSQAQEPCPISFDGAFSEGNCNVTLVFDCRDLAEAFSSANSTIGGFFRTELNGNEIIYVRPAGNCDDVTLETFTVPTQCAAPDASLCPTCPDLSGITDLGVQVSESACFTIGGMTGGNRPGEISAPTGDECPTGSTLEYSLDNFATAGTTTIPSYDDQNEITVSTRCVCEIDDTVMSPVSSVTTVPGECPEPPPCGYEFDIETMVSCNNFTFEINNISAIGDEAMVRNIFVIINGSMETSLSPGTTMYTSDGFPADGSSYAIRLFAAGANPAFNCETNISVTAPSGEGPVMPTIIPSAPTTHN